MFTPQLTVLGAGLMGVGIACHFARHGHAVRLYDTDPARISEIPASPPPFCASSKSASSLTLLSVRRCSRASPAPRH